MYPSIFLAKLFGLYLIIISLFLIFRRDALMQTLQSFIANSALMMFAGVFNLIAGLAVLIGHPVWGLQWETLITVLGLLMFIKGIYRFGFPTTCFQWELSFIQKKAKWNWMIGIMIIYGLVLTVKGAGI